MQKRFITHKPEIGVYEYKIIVYVFSCFISSFCCAVGFAFALILEEASSYVNCIYSFRFNFFFSLYKIGLDTIPVEVSIKHVHEFKKKILIV